MSGGRLILVGTPIGNLDDLAPRAVAALAGADVICCEDTRRTGRLLQRAGVEARQLLMVNDHNEAARADEVSNRLATGQTVAVVTDAGMPGISDPGERLVRAAAANGHPIEVVPGPSAAVAALVVSGLPTGRFCFEGFLPRRGKERAARLDMLAGEARTIVLFEAPHRIVETLADLAAAFGGERRVAVARELTKLHEEVWRGTLAQAIAWAEGGQRGEYVLVVDGAPPAAEPDDAAVAGAVQAALDRGMSKRDAAASVAAELGVSKRRAYAAANERSATA